MTVTPIRMAKLANARRMIAEILQARQCMYAEEAARMVLDELQKLGWAPPGLRDDDDVPQPSNGGSPAARRAALEAAEAAVRAAKDRRKKPAEESA